MVKMADMAAADSRRQYRRQPGVGHRRQPGVGQIGRTALLSLRGASGHPELVEGRGNLDEVERTSANRGCYDAEIATLRSQ